MGAAHGGLSCELGVGHRGVLVDAARGSPRCMAQDFRAVPHVNALGALGADRAEYKIWRGWRHWGGTGVTPGLHCPSFALLVGPP